MNVLIEHKLKITNTDENGDKAILELGLPIEQLKPLGGLMEKYQDLIFPAMMPLIKNWVQAMNGTFKVKFRGSLKFMIQSNAKLFACEYGFKHLPLDRYLEINGI